MGEKGEGEKKNWSKGRYKKHKRKMSATFRYGQKNVDIIDSDNSIPF